MRNNGLFTTGPETHLNACVGKNGGPYDRFDFGDGYFAAASLIVAEIEKGTANITNYDDIYIVIDDLIYPICFNYRQFLELYIKEIVRLERKNFSFDGITDKIKGHEFKKSHEALKKIREHGENLDRLRHVTFSIIDEALNAWHKIDSRGTIFRYPDTPDDKAHLDGWPLINIAVLRNKMLSTRVELKKWRSTLGVDG